MIKSKIYNLAHSGITCPGSYLLLLSHFSCVWLCVTPFLGSSRQEHWSGLPFPSPMHKSEKWKWSCSVMSDSSRPHGLQPTRLLRPWDFPGKRTGVGCYCLPGLLIHTLEMWELGRVRLGPKSCSCFWRLLLETGWVGVMSLCAGNVLYFSPTVPPTMPWTPRQPVP